MVGLARQHTLSSAINLRHPHKPVLLCRSVQNWRDLDMQRRCSYLPVQRQRLCCPCRHQHGSPTPRQHWHYQLAVQRAFVQPLALYEPNRSCNKAAPALQLRLSETTNSGKGEALRAGQEAARAVTLPMRKRPSLPPISTSLTLFPFLCMHNLSASVSQPPIKRTKRGTE